MCPHAAFQSANVAVLLRKLFSGPGTCHCRFMPFQSHPRLLCAPVEFAFSFFAPPLHPQKTIYWPRQSAHGPSNRGMLQNAPARPPT